MSYQDIINEAWEGRASLGPATTGPVRAAVEDTLARLDAGGTTRTPATSC